MANKVRRTTSEKELRGMCKAGMSAAEIADALIVPVNEVYAVLRVLGIRSEVRARSEALRDKDLSVVAKRMAAGETVRAIAKDRGEAFITLYQRLRRAGFPTSRFEAMKSRLTQEQ